MTDHAWIFFNHKNELKYMNLSQIQLIKKIKKIMTVPFHVVSVVALLRKLDMVLVLLIHFGPSSFGSNQDIKNANNTKRRDFLDIFRFLGSHTHLATTNYNEMNTNILAISKHCRIYFRYFLDFLVIKYPTKYPPSALFSNFQTY